MNNPAFTDKQIADAETVLSKTYRNSECEHPDCIRIATAWLTAQRPGRMGGHRPLKHIMESWGGRYLSEKDVMTAAYLLGLKGTYIALGISSRFVFPSVNRLTDIGEAFAHPNYCTDVRHELRYFEHYKLAETGQSLEQEKAFYIAFARTVVEARGKRFEW